MRMGLAWLANSQPDFLFQNSQLAQITEDIYKRQPQVYIGRLKKAIRYAIDNRTTLKVPKLDSNLLRIVGFSDASFANNHDHSTKLGCIMFSVDSTDTVVPLVFKS